MASITNLIAYKFARLPELKPLRDRLVARCKELELKGTIILSTEGINLYVAGAAERIDELLRLLREIPGLADLAPKSSQSDHQPFSRMLVRIKKEIIAFGVDGICPAQYTSPKVQPSTLKQWLDQGRPLTLLDTRNDYEVKLGTFKSAIPIGVTHFRQFPEAVERLPSELKEQAVVIFCTSGIRCEKAGPYLEKMGFRNILQLDGGILKYFEECGAAHYQGECFVFDKRVSLDPALHESDSAQCYACQTPLSAEEMRNPVYEEGKSCPYCFKPAKEQMAENIAKRQEAIRLATTPLPGSQPYDNYRPFSVSSVSDGQNLLEFIHTIFPHAPAGEWEELINNGLVLNESRHPVSAEQLVRAGERYFRLLPAMIEPEVNPAIEIVHEDEAILVLNKPAPLPMHPSGRFNRNTLQSILYKVYSPQKPRAAHRLDANTTGLVVCARTGHFAGKLQPQFARGNVEKVYLARIHGKPDWTTLECTAPISIEPGEVGTREVDEENGLAAHTDFQVIKQFEDGTSLLEARPRTGRTNQIRVHLWQLGLPICGDQVYVEGKQFGQTQTASPADPPLCLHAWRLSFTHPLTNEKATFETAQPGWAV